MSAFKLQFIKNTFDVIVLKNGEENESYFVGNEVARALGYKDPKGAVQKHCPDRISFSELKSKSGQNGPTLVCQPQTSMISEGDILSLIFCS